MGFSENEELTVCLLPKEKLGFPGNHKVPRAGGLTKTSVSARYNGKQDGTVYL